MARPRLGPLTVLQAAQAGAAPGTIMNIASATEVLVEVSGTFSGITANFEGSFDTGVTWFPVALLAVSVVPVINALVATAAGFYRLDQAHAFTAFRARTTVAAPTGAMTVRAIHGIVW